MLRIICSVIADLNLILSHISVCSCLTRHISKSVNQLGALLEQMMSPEQYDANVKTKKSGTEFVEFAIKLPAAMQEQIILPLRAQNYATLVPGKKSERTVFTMAKFTIPLHLSEVIKTW